MAKVIDKKDLGRRISSLGNPKVRKATEQVRNLLRESMLSLALSRGLGPVGISKSVGIGQMTKSLSRIYKRYTSGNIRKSMAKQYFKQTKDLLQAPERYHKNVDKIKFNAALNRGSAWFTPGLRSIALSPQFSTDSGSSRELPHELLHSVQFNERNLGTPDYLELFRLKSAMIATLENKGHSEEYIRGIISTWRNDKFPADPLEQQAYPFASSLSKNPTPEEYSTLELRTLRRAISSSKSILYDLQEGKFP